MKKFLTLVLMGLMMVVVGSVLAQQKEEFVETMIEIKADIVDAYDGQKTVGDELIIVANRRTMYSNSTAIEVVAFFESEARTIGFTITHYGDIGILLETGDFNQDGKPDVLLTYKSGDKELIYFNPEYQSIDVVPYN